MLNCKKCEKYSKCKTLCKSAEKYVNQDHVSKKEIPLSELDLDPERVKDTGENVFGVTTDPKLLIYKMYFLDNKSVKYISYYIPFTEQWIFKIIKKLKNNIINESGERKKQILDLHFKQYKKEYEIAFLLNIPQPNVNVVISSYLNKQLV